MRIETTTRELFTFDELSPEAKAKALDRCRDWNVDGFDWWDGVEDGFEADAKRLGWAVERIYFRGFWSQGDGACFEGRWSPPQNCEAAVREHAPGDAALIALAQRFDKLARTATAPDGETWAATVRQSGHYSHEGCTRFEFDAAPEAEGFDVEEFVAASRALMRYLYRALEAEYEYLTSDDAVAESLRANECEFTADGKPA